MLDSFVLPCLFDPFQDKHNSTYGLCLLVTSLIFDGVMTSSQVCLQLLSSLLLLFIARRSCRFAVKKGDVLDGGGWLWCNPLFCTPGPVFYSSPSSFTLSWDIRFSPGPNGKIIFFNILSETPSAMNALIGVSSCLSLLIWCCTQYKRKSSHYFFIKKWSLSRLLRVCSACMGVRRLDHGYPAA